MPITLTSDPWIEAYEISDKAVYSDIWVSIIDTYFGGGGGGGTIVGTTHSRNFISLLFLFLFLNLIWCVINHLKYTNNVSPEN